MATLVLPIPGVALAAEMVEERISKLADGTLKTEIVTSRIYRDADGRMRTETSIGEEGERAMVVHIVDGVAGFMALLVPSEKQGGRFQFPKQDPSQRFGVAFFGNPLIRVPGEKSFHTESPGKQIIDGIEYEGERVTTSSAEQPSLVGVEERWFARDLGLFALIKSAGPDDQSTATLTRVDRHAPDPALFEIPFDYFIQDLNDELPSQ
jgi:hypothetical protein